jgi:hypothetical protein
MSRKKRGIPRGGAKSRDFRGRRTARRAAFCLAGRGNRRGGCRAPLTRVTDMVSEHLTWEAVNALQPWAGFDPLALPRRSPVSHAVTRARRYAQLVVAKNVNACCRSVSDGAVRNSPAGTWAGGVAEGRRGGGSARHATPCTLKAGQHRLHCTPRHTHARQSTGQMGCIAPPTHTANAARGKAAGPNVISFRCVLSPSVK